MTKLDCLKCRMGLLLSLFYTNKPTEESSQHYQNCDDCYIWNYIRGLYFGYPPCCIESFSAQLAGVKPSAVQLAVASDRFIPCRMHALQIHHGLQKIEDLIGKTRKAPRSFGDGMIEPLEFAQGLH